jgi:hypothetical protein
LLRPPRVFATGSSGRTLSNQKCSSRKSET